ncbi:hypothetical protein [Cupriavidus basilensis]|nr:hypothetical protein [Cupriavidus basilensis]MDF3883142.1 hypothetical protein [Cupriavidus basilensis]
MQADPARRRVVALTREIYGADAEDPSRAGIYIQAEDRPGH